MDLRSSLSGEAAIKILLTAVLRGLLIIVAKPSERCVMSQQS